MGILVNMLSSIETQIPFTYGYLDLCNEEGPRPNETFTELLSGTRAQYTNYIFNMNFNETCISYCVKEFKDYDIDDYKWLIDIIIIIFILKLIKKMINFKLLVFLLNLYQLNKNLLINVKVILLMMVLF